MFGVSQICRYPQCIVSIIGKLPRKRLTGLFRSAGQDELHSLPAQKFGDSLSDTATGSGNYSYFAAEIGKTG